MSEKEIEDHLNFVRSLNLSFKDYFKYVMANFSEVELRIYKAKVYKEKIKNLQEEGKKEQRNAAYENMWILENGLKNTFLDN